MREDGISLVHEVIHALSDRLSLRTLVLPHNYELYADTLRKSTWVRNGEYPKQDSGQVRVLSTWKRDQDN